MATVKKRINISLSKDVQRMLVEVAKRDQIPAATKAERLLEIGLELDEDQVWDRMAARRDIESASFVSHRQAFGD